MRRRTLLVALAVLAVVIAVGVVVLWPRQERITRENFDRVKEGMSLAEVEAIFGPPWDYSIAPEECAPALKQLALVYPTVRGWSTNTAWVTIAFDEAGGMAEKRFVTKGRLRQSTLGNFLWWAELQWRQWFQ